MKANKSLLKVEVAIGAITTAMILIFTLILFYVPVVTNLIRDIFYNNNAIITEN